MQTWIEVDRAALRHNLSAVQKLVGTSTGIIAVVKANAYGCGALECSKVFAEAGASMLAVTRLDEALPIRSGGVEAPILLLAPALPDEYETIVELELTASISSFDEAQQINATAEKLGKVARVQIKINTGMNRFGAPAEKVAEIWGRSKKLANLRVEAAFTHFANATDPKPEPTLEQFEVFKNATYGIEGLPFHVANSAALVRFAEMRLDFVRPGTLLYGQFPAPSIGQLGKTAGMELRDPFKAKTRVVALQNLQAGDKVGYGSEWTASANAKIAVLALGWADGLAIEPHARVETPLSAVKGGLERAARLKKNPNAGRLVELRGQKVPIVGRVAMQTCAVDVTRLEEVQIGDEVVVPMRRVTAGAHMQRVYVN